VGFNVGGQTKNGGLLLLLIKIERKRKKRGSKLPFFKGRQGEVAALRKTQEQGFESTVVCKILFFTWQKGKAREVRLLHKKK